MKNLVVIAILALSLSTSAFAYWDDSNDIQRHVGAIRQEQYMLNFADKREAGALRDDIKRHVQYLRSHYGVEVP